MPNDKITGALLTPSQRDFLRDGPSEDTSDAAARMIKGRIEDRIEAAVLIDAALIDNAEETDHAIDHSKIADTDRSGEVAEGIRSLVALLYRIGDATNADPEKAIEDGMNRARGERLERILEKIDRDPATTITPDELQTLNDHGYLPDDAHSQLFKQWLGSRGQIDAGAVRDAMRRED